MGLVQGVVVQGRDQPVDQRRQPMRRLRAGELVTLERLAHALLDSGEMAATQPDGDVARHRGVRGGGQGGCQLAGRRPKILGWKMLVLVCLTGLTGRGRMQHFGLS